MTLKNIRNLDPAYIIGDNQLLTIDGFIVRLSYKGCPNGWNLYGVNIFNANGGDALQWLASNNFLNVKVNKDNTFTIRTMDPIKELINIFNNIMSEMLFQLPPDRWNIIPNWDPIDDYYKNNPEIAYY